MAALAQVDQGQREPGVEHGRERDDDRTRRAPPRAAPKCLCVLSNSFAGPEHGVEHPIELALADVGAEPSGPPATERDDPGPVTVAQRGLHHLSRAAQRPARWRPSPDPAGCGYMSMITTTSAARSVSRSVTCRLAAAGADRPVHGAELVAGHVGANVGELDTRADVPGEVGPQAVEQFGPRHRRGLRRRQREHEDVGDVDAAPSRSSARRARATSDRARNGYRPQRCADAATLFALRLRRRAPRRPCPPTADNSSATATASSPSEVSPPAIRACSFSKQRCESGSRLHRDLRHRALPADRAQHPQQRRHEGDQLPARPDHRGGQRHPHARRDRPRQRRCAPTQFDLVRVFDHAAVTALARGARHGQTLQQLSTTSAP